MALGELLTNLKLRLTKRRRQDCQQQKSQLRSDREKVMKTKTMMERSHVAARNCE